MKTKIGILYICTGKYSIFWKDFYLSMEKNFIEDSEKHYFVFTDNENIEFEFENKNIHKIYQKNLGWPDNTLKRFHVFLSKEEEISNMDYLFFFNANLLVKETITKEEFLPTGSYNLLATIHPGFYDKPRQKFTYETNNKSCAYIASEKGEKYFAGGLNGGKAIDFIVAMKQMKEQTDTDEKNQTIAVWHDESHWNKYLIDRNDIKRIEPSYLYPEGWSIPFNIKILIRDKNKYGGHNLLRNKNENSYKIIKSNLLKVISKSKELINIATRYLYFRKLITNDINIKNSELLITTIAFNNLEILKIQKEYIKNNLKESYNQLIADNSNYKIISEEIRIWCKKENIPYIKIPHNPYKNPSKSHGFAINWTYRNIIQKYKPKYFGFIDHDIFPYKKTYITPYAKNNIFGLVQERGKKWYLWAGFCFFNYEKTKKYKLNFMPAKGLDTGGSNYNNIYKHIDKNNLSFIKQTYIDILDKKIVSSINNSNTTKTIEIINEWAHLMRISNWNNETSNKTSSTKEIVSIINKLIV